MNQFPENIFVSYNEDDIENPFLLVHESIEDAADNGLLIGGEGSGPGGPVTKRVGGLALYQLVKPISIQTTHQVIAGEAS